MVIKSFPVAPWQFTLEGILKKIASFDQKKKVVAIGSSDIVNILLEMQKMFESEVALPRDFLPPVPTKRVAREVVPRVNGILNGGWIFNKEPTPQLWKKVSAETLISTRVAKRVGSLVSPSKETPPSTYRDLLTPKQREVVDAIYGWDGEKFNKEKGVKGVDVAKKRGVTGATISILLKAARQILWQDELDETSPEETKEPVELMEPKSNGWHKKNADLEEEVHIPAFLKNRRQVRATPIPKRESIRPTYDISEPRVAPITERPKFETIVVATPKPLPIVEEVPEVIEPIIPDVTFPEFLWYEASLAWLRNEPSVQAGLEAAQNIPSFKRDDLSITALFRREYPVLHTAFTRLRSLSKHSCLEIIHDIYHPDPLLILKKEPEVLQKVKACFAHHKKGEYESFTQALKEISHDADLAGKIMEICERYTANSFIEGLSLIVDFPWTAADDKMYETVSLRDVFRHTTGFSSLLQTIERLPSDVSFKDLQKKLNSLNVVVISWVTSWPRYKSSQATFMTLLALLQSLIKQESDYKKDDETSTKKLRRKLAQIVGS